MRYIFRIDILFMELWDKAANTFCLKVFLLPCQKQASILTWTAHTSKTSCHWSLHMSIRSGLSGRCLTRTVSLRLSQRLKVVFPPSISISDGAVRQLWFAPSMSIDYPEVMQLCTDAGVFLHSTLWYQVLSS